MKVNLPSDVKSIILELENNGFEAYAVGGCVRDSILGRIPEDWDITTSAKPEDIKAIFSRTVDTGIQHGTVTVLIGDCGYEVTTYRIDGTYSDGRHPDEVVFTSNLTEDLKRRDFTINAMAYNERSGIVDKFDGIKDLERKVIRCVGNPYERFEEDALRIFRAVRFSAQLGFSIEDGTKQAIKDLSPNLEKISAERIQTELVKLLISNEPERMEDLYQLGITKVMLPEFDIMMETDQNSLYHYATVGGHTIDVLKNVPATKVLRITALLHDVSKPECITTDKEGHNHFKFHPEKGAEKAVKILRRLKFDNDTISKVKTLILYHDVRPSTPKGVRRLVNKVGLDLFPDLIALKWADFKGQSDYKIEEKRTLIEFCENYFEVIKKENQCTSLKTLAVNGKDLINLGITEGKVIGNTLNFLLEKVLEKPELNDKETLLSFVRKNKV